jgi:hypothetical protein
MKYTCPKIYFKELRVLSNSRISLMKCSNALKNTITAVMDEYFPEIVTVFKYPLKGKQILKSCLFPTLILESGIDGVLAGIKKQLKRPWAEKRLNNLWKWRRH